MKTNNNIANHIASKGVAKHMTRDAAVSIWKDLKRDGWEVDLNTRQAPMLAKHDEEGTQRFFTFETKGNRISVSYMQLEVAL